MLESRVEIVVEGEAGEARERQQEEAEEEDDSDGDEWGGGRNARSGMSLSRREG